MILFRIVEFETVKVKLVISVVILIDAGEPDERCLFPKSWVISFYISDKGIFFLSCRHFPINFGYPNAIMKNKTIRINNLSSFLLIFILLIYFYLFIFICLLNILIFSDFINIIISKNIMLE